jgi:simple sugar transport system ATP-binding protein
MSEGSTSDESTAGARELILRCEGITVFFGGVRALADVSLTLYPGEIIGLVGENGAGKSTLARVLSGLLEPDQGRILVGEHELDTFSRERMRSIGIETVYQNLMLCDNLSATANIMLYQEPVTVSVGPFRIIDRGRSLAETKRRLADLGVVLDDYAAPVRRLSGGQRQAIAIARAMVRGHRLLILDEPTAALGLRQKRATLDLIRRVADQGVGVILISHNLDEVMAVAERIVALRLGEVSLDRATRSTSRTEIEGQMSGFLTEPR